MGKLYYFYGCMNSAKSAVSNAVSKIKSLFSFSLPKFKIPKPSINIGTTTKTVLGVSIKVPTFSVSWNAKGGIFKRPTIFNTPNAGLQGVGEAGAEAIIPLDSFYDHLDSKLESITNNTNNNVVINLNDVHLHNNLDIETLTEQIAFTLQRKTRFQ